MTSLDAVGYFATPKQRLLATDKHIAWNKAHQLLTSFKVPKPVIFVHSQTVEMRWDHLVVYTFPNRPTIILKIENNQWIEGNIKDLGVSKEREIERLD